MTSAVVSDLFRVPEVVGLGIPQSPPILLLVLRRLDVSSAVVIGSIVVDNTGMTDNLSYQSG